MHFGSTVSPYLLFGSINWELDIWVIFPLLTKNIDNVKPKGKKNRSYVRSRSLWPPGANKTVLFLYFFFLVSAASCLKNNAINCKLLI